MCLIISPLPIGTNIRYEIWKEDQLRSLDTIENIPEFKPLVKLISKKMALNNVDNVYFKNKSRETILSNTLKMRSWCNSWGNEMITPDYINRCVIDENSDIWQLYRKCFVKWIKRKEKEDNFKWLSAYLNLEFNLLLLYLLINHYYDISIRSF